MSYPASSLSPPPSSPPDGSPTPAPERTIGTPSARLVSRGVNVSRWFRFPADDSESHALSFLTDADLDLLNFLGVSAVRLAVAPAQLLAPGTTDRPDPRRLAYIDRAIARFVSRGLFVVLQYHDETRAMETSMSAVDAFERLWTALARHFGDFSPGGLALEILNEPVFDRAPRAWFPIQRRIVAAVRAPDPLTDLSEDQRLEATRRKVCEILKTPYFPPGEGARLVENASKN